MKRRVLRAASRVLCETRQHPDRHEWNGGKVLVLMLTHLGDAVLFLPFLDALGTFFGDRSIDIVIKPPVDQLICSHPGLRTIHVFHCPWVGAGGWRTGIGQWLGLVRNFRREKYDLAVVTHAHEMSSLTACLSGANGTAGWATEGDHFLGCPLITPLRKPHAAVFAAQLLDHLGLPRVPHRTGLPVSDEAYRRGKDVARGLRKANGGAGSRILAVHPGAGGERKIWPADNFSAVIHAFLGGKNRTVILLGGEKERTRCSEIIDLVGSNRVADLSGKLGVGELAGAISEGDMYLGNDSGPSHMAAALGVPTHVIFGQASDPGVWAPIGPQVHVLRFAEEEFRSGRSVAKVLTALRIGDRCSNHGDTIVNACPE